MQQKSENVQISDTGEVSGLDLAKSTLNLATLACVLYWGCLAIAQGQRGRGPAVTFTTKTQEATARENRVLPKDVEVDPSVLAAKESLHSHFAETRERIRRVCQREMEDGGNPWLQSRTKDLYHWSRFLLFNVPRGNLFCPITKSASSYWFGFLVRDREDANLKNWYKRSRLGLEDTTAAGVGPRKEAKRRLFAQPSNWTLEIAAAKLVTVAFVRHPLERFVSAFADKMIFNSWGDEDRWGQLYNGIRPWRDRILKEQRNVSDPENHPEMTPTENEFVDDFLKYIKEDLRAVNNHIKPQYLACPFCLFDFDAVGKLEHFSSDATAVLRDAFHVAEPNLEKENRRHKAYTTKDFVSAVTPERLLRLREAYRLDMEMFGYDVDEDSEFGLGG